MDTACEVASSGAQRHHDQRSARLNQPQENARVPGAVLRAASVAGGTGGGGRPHHNKREGTPKRCPLLAGAHPDTYFNTPRHSGPNMVNYDSRMHKISLVIPTLLVGALVLTGCSGSSKAAQASSTPSSNSSANVAASSSSSDSSGGLEWANGPSAAATAALQYEQSSEWSDGWQMSVSTPKLLQAPGKPEKFAHDPSGVEWSSLSEQQFIVITVTIANNTGSEARLNPWYSPTAKTDAGLGAAVNFVNDSGQTIAFSGDPSSSSEVFTHGGFKTFTYYYMVDGDPATTQITGSPTDGHGAQTWQF